MAAMSRSTPAGAAGGPTSQEEGLNRPSWT